MVMTARLPAGNGQIICSRERTDHVLPTQRHIVALTATRPHTYSLAGEAAVVKPSDVPSHSTLGNAEKVSGGLLSETRVPARRASMVKRLRIVLAATVSMSCLLPIAAHAGGGAGIPA